MIVRNLGRVAIAVMTAALLFLVGARTGISAQQAPPGAQQPPAAGGGRGGPQPPKNIQVLKDVPLDQLQLTMQYIAASLGVQCNYCHVQGQNDLDDKDTKKRAREMMQMVQDINGKFFDGTPRLSCASCHNGRAKPLRTPPLSVDMSPAEAAVAAAGRGRGGRGGPGGGRCAGAVRHRRRAGRRSGARSAGGGRGSRRPRWTRPWRRTAGASRADRDGRRSDREIRPGARRAAGAAGREDPRDDRRRHVA